VGIFCRLGFAQLKSGVGAGSDDIDLHESWKEVLNGTLFVDYYAITL